MGRGLGGEVSLLSSSDGRPTSKIEVLDPCEANRVVFRATEYEDAKLWLLEDEYEMVQGRVPLDDG